MHVCLNLVTLNARWSIKDKLMSFMNAWRRNGVTRTNNILSALSSRKTGRCEKNMSFQLVDDCIFVHVVLMSVWLYSIAIKRPQARMIRPRPFGERLLESQTWENSSHVVVKFMNYHLNDSTHIHFNITLLLFEVCSLKNVYVERENRNKAFTPRFEVQTTLTYNAGDKHWLYSVLLDSLGVWQLECCTFQ